MKMVEQGKATEVYVAQDADPRLKDKIVRALRRWQDVPIYLVETMKMLGETCGIEVGAAMAAVIPETNKEHNVFIEPKRNRDKNFHLFLYEPPGSVGLISRMS